jgi:hypothetical protein
VEGIGQLKNQMTPMGIESATFRLVAAKKIMVEMCSQVSKIQELQMHSLDSVPPPLLWIDIYLSLIKDTRLHI